MKKIECLKNIKIAHRGLWNEDYPENSIGAFLRCIEKNIPIEFDVHLLKDNTLVVFHDNNLKRMTEKNILLKDTNYEAIKNYRLKNSEYKIPTLDEVLRLVDGKVLLDIELKSDVKGFKICKEICKYLDKYDGDFIIKSFNPFYIFWFRINRPNFIRGLLVSKLSKSDMNKICKYILFKMWFNFLAKPDFIAFNHKNLPNKKIERYKDRGLPILLFTVKEKNISNFNDYNYGYLFEE